MRAWRSARSVASRDTNRWRPCVGRVPRMSGPRFGLTGLAVMGANLARNVAHHDIPIAVHNRTASKTEQFMSEHGSEGPITGTGTTEEFVQALERPRTIMTMVKAGPAVDAVIEELAPLLDEGDTIVDGGNSHFRDTQRRDKAMNERGLRFLGVGVSGGEEGALKGPSIMPGGAKEAYDGRRAHLHLDRRPGRRHAVLHLRRRRRRGPLREDGPQRHRVRGHPADRRGLRPAAPRRRARGAGDRAGLPRVERGRPRLVPDRDHRDRARQDRRAHRPAARRRDPRPGRAEGHRAAGRRRTRSSSACR